MDQAKLAHQVNQDAGFVMKQVDRGRYLARVTGATAVTHPDICFQKERRRKRYRSRVTVLDGGPWGTTYAKNLRLFVNEMSEEQWVGFAGVLKARHPMPWFNLNIMQAEDLKAIYQFIRYLGPGGQAAPGYVPSDQEPNTPFALFPSSP
jgi:hypothetical protein